MDAAKPEAAAYRLWDSELKGYGLKVTPAGVKTFFAWYRAGTGRGAARREFTIGRSGTITAEEARGEAEKVISLARLGGDPQRERDAGRKDPTIADLCDRYLEEGCTTKKASTLATDRGRIARHIKPLLGTKRLSDVAREDIDRFLRDVAAGKTAAIAKTKLRGKAVVRGGRGTATRTLGLLGAIFQFAVDRRLRADNPVRGVKRFADRSLDRFLSPTELGRLGDALAGAEAEGTNLKAVQAIRLLALTGARRGEIVNLRWAEVDAAHGCLRLGDSKTGQKVVPLGAAALLALSEIKRAPKAVFVFPSEKAPERPYDGLPKAWVAIRARAGLDDVRLHDLRHSFASVGLASGQGLPLIGKLLGHAHVATTQRYAHLADDPIRVAADRISAEIGGAMERGASGRLGGALEH